MWGLAGGRQVVADLNLSSSKAIAKGKHHESRPCIVVGDAKQELCGFDG